MNILLFLIPISLVLLGIAIWAFFWATGSGQFEDLDSPAWRILLDDDTRPPATGPDTESGQSERPSL